MQEHVNKRGDEVHSAWKTVTEDRAEVAISGSGCGVIDRVICHRKGLFQTSEAALLRENGKTMKSARDRTYRDIRALNRILVVSWVTTL